MYNKQKVQESVDRFRRELKRNIDKFTPAEQEIVAMSVLTIDFFMRDTMPCDRVAVDRIDSEVALCYTIMLEHF